MGDTTPPTEDGTAAGSRAPAATTAFLPIGLVFLVIGLAQVRDGAGIAFLVLGIVFLGMSAGSGWAEFGGGPSGDDPGRPRS